MNEQDLIEVKDLDCTTAARLLSCMQLGVTIMYDSGHRYIDFLEEPPYDNSLMGKIKSFNANCVKNDRKDNIIIIDNYIKFYETLEDALDFIDYILIKMKHESLIEYFTKYNQWGKGTCYDSSAKKVKDFKKNSSPWWPK